MYRDLLMTDVVSMPIVLNPPLSFVSEAVRFSSVLSNSYSFSAVSVILMVIDVAFILSLIIDSDTYVGILRDITIAVFNSHRRRQEFCSLSYKMVEFMFSLLDCSLIR